MYLQALRIQNFRCFGTSEIFEFNKGLNVLVGENDSGKTAIIDAIRIAMGTTDQGWYHVALTDFYNEDKNLEISIVLKFADLSLDEQASFLECLTFKDGKSYLYVYWRCKYLLNFNPPRIFINVTTGYDGEGPSISPEARELLRVTYLRPLRDAYTNMQSGRNSRLSQIIHGIPHIDDGIHTYSQDTKLDDLSISGVASLSDYLLANNAKLQQANNDIASIMNSKMLLKGDNVQTAFTVTGANISEEKRLSSLLEKLDLTAHSNGTVGKIGLGTSNVLSMACELLLNHQEGSSFLLIEEPEAHIHAQRQIRLMQSLQETAEKSGSNQQIIITTHSPLMASVVKLENISIIKNTKMFSLRPEKTNLASDDYKYLERYLDATKANLFFAKAIMIVEGPAEELLIPTIAKLMNRDFAQYGVSIINARGIGLNRFARIFQRANPTESLGINVACVTDRDIMPNCAPEICIDSKYKDTPLPNISDRKWHVESDYPSEERKQAYLDGIKNRATGQSVKTFIADHWTFEYDLAYSGLNHELLDAIISLQYSEPNRETKKQALLDECKGLEDLYGIEGMASCLYRSFYKKNVSKALGAQELSFILENKYTNTPEVFISKLPPYIKDAIYYVTEGAS